MTLTPNRKQKVNDKLLSIESWAFKARHLPTDEEEELKRHAKNIGNAYSELDSLLNITDEQFEKWGWGE